MLEDDVDSQEARFRQAVKYVTAAIGFVTVNVMAVLLNIVEKKLLG